MAKRKVANRAARRVGGGRAKTAKSGRGAVKQARTAGSSAPKAPRAASGKAAGRTGAGGSASRKATPAPGAVKDAPTTQRGASLPRTPEDVTAEVQGQWDLEEKEVPTPPSTLAYEPPASAARSGRAQLAQRRREHTETGPAITGGDVDADWEGAYSVGDEAATGSNPTPDQDTVEGVGRAVGVDYEDTEELKSTWKIDRRDKKRWELDPASAEDYRERNRKGGR